MKAIFSLLMILSTVEVFAQLSPEQCQYSCSHECIRYADKMRRIADDIDFRCTGNITPQPPTPPYPPTPPVPPPQQPGARVEYFSNDSCGGLVAISDRYTPCDVNSSQNVWSIRVDGRCYDIADSTLGRACVSFQNASPHASLKMFSNDSCGGLVAMSSSPYECDRIASVNRNNVWSIELNGRCVDISDSNVPAVCASFAASDNPGATQLFSNDSCGGLVAMVDYRTNCEELARNTGNRNVWSIRMQNGQCTDISDTDIRTACNRFGGR